MANCNDQKNPLLRSGTAQSERLLPGLQNDYVNVDEKTFADWIVFAKEFAQYLHYYELNDAKSGDWVPFFSSDVSAVLGTIAVQDADAYRRNIKTRLDFLKDDDHVTMLPAAERKLHELFSVIINFCVSLDEFYKLLPSDIALKQGIENLIKTNLAGTLRRFLGYYKAAKTLGYLKPGNLTGLKVLGLPVLPVEQIVEGSGLSNLWWKQSPIPASWNAYYTAIAKDESIFGNAALDVYFDSLYIVNTNYTANQWRQYMKMNHAANHNLFSGVFDVFLMAYSKLVTDAEKELLVTLERRNTHPAHYALFLVFLRLFRFAQDDINTITQRHLDFYYKEILQLKQKAALPNSTHILAELAKPVDDFILAADTLFKAGKDSGGKEVLYDLDAETAFNKATVKDLRAVYIGEAGDDDLPGSLSDGRLFAAPVINSSDGAGAELTSANKEWHPIANRLYSEGDVIDIQMPVAEIGFAVASHYLYLQEGVRTIMLRLATGKDEDNEALTGKQYIVYLTTEKEWYKVNTLVSVVVANKMNNGTESCAEFSFTLTGDEPPITNYNAEIHSGTLNVNAPVVKVVLVNDEAASYKYKELRDIVVNKIEVAVEVGMQTSGFNQQGLKQLLVSTEAGPVDVSKPFMPFGGQPRRDATLVVGSKELFSKKNAKIKLNIEWGGISDFLPGNIDFDTIDDYYPYMKFGFLQGGLWNTVNSELNIFDSNNTNVQVFSTSQNISAAAIVPYEDEYVHYNAGTSKGFMRFLLNGSFGHKEYLKAQSVYLINLANKVTPNPEPKEPYTPVIQSLYISYSASSGAVNINSATKKAFEQKSASLFHLYPFGDAEQHAYLNQPAPNYLLPQFRHKNKDGIDVLHQGEFHIGFENLQPQQSVNVLFQVMDGTADPTISKPAEHIQWSYLSNNQWKDFDKNTISDGTMQLIQSGIISFIIPGDATTDNTLMPSGLLWIKASVENKVDAVCKLLTVDAQAAVVTFRDNDNAADFLNTALPAGTITKLKAPQASIKKIKQPYSSFGGRAMESNDAFYVRVSERLRHKARAITIWDYEHLILEEFPLIHKVKCLNHTKSQDADYNEVLPGHVTIITIPDLKQRNDVNPLKPYTSQAMLQAIHDFLKKKISCHVQLHVVNPDFEEVKLKFLLKLAKGYDDFTVYRKKLQEEITAFLSPWAYGGTDINFGGKIYKSVLINFIEERSYVDFITDVEMAHYDADKNLLKADNDEIIASTAKSILVSVPASKHEIDPYPDNIINEQYECAYIESIKKGSNKLL